MDNDTLSDLDDLDSLLGDDPIQAPASKAQEAEAVLSGLGDIDALAERAMGGSGLDAKSLALIEEHPGAIDVAAFKLRLGLAMAERAAMMAEDDPERAADLLDRALAALGPRAPSAAALAASAPSAHGSESLLDALSNAARHSHDPARIAIEAREQLARKERARLGLGSPADGAEAAISEFSLAVESALEASGAERQIGAASRPDSKAAM